MPPRHNFRTYDQWKTSDPNDEFLGPEPSDDREYEYEDRYEDAEPEPPEATP